MREMDLPGILTRAPALCLIDELAHTNAPGLEHGKRYEDVEAVLEAGIDVFSTLNVQHLESLNDQLAEHSGVRVRETLPDQALQKADEIVLVDVTPEALLERLRSGKVYPAERIDAALTASSGSRTWRRCARRRCGRSPRRSWPSVRCRTRCTARPRSASVCSRSSSRRRARSGSCAARGAARNGSGPTSTYSGSSRRASADGREGARARRPRPADLGARRQPDRARIRRPRRHCRPEIRERGTTYVLVGESSWRSRIASITT